MLLSIWRSGGRNENTTLAVQTPACLYTFTRSVTLNRGLYVPAPQTSPCVPLRTVAFPGIDVGTSLARAFGSLFDELPTYKSSRFHDANVRCACLRLCADYWRRCGLGRSDSGFSN